MPTHTIRDERFKEELEKLGWKIHPHTGFWIPNWHAARNTNGAIEQMKQACIAAVECGAALTLPAEPFNRDLRDAVLEEAAQCAARVMQDSTPYERDKVAGCIRAQIYAKIPDFVKRAAGASATPAPSERVDSAMVTVAMAEASMPEFDSQSPYQIIADSLNRQLGEA